MNKSQELDIMILRAKMHAEEVLEEHNRQWYEEEPQEVEEE